MSEENLYSNYEDTLIYLKSIDGWNFPQKYRYDDPFLIKTRDVMLHTNDDKLIPAHRFILLNNNIYFRYFIKDRLYTEEVLDCIFQYDDLLNAVRLIYGDTIVIRFQELVPLAEICAYYRIDFVAIQKPANEDDTSYGK